MLPATTTECSPLERDAPPFEAERDALLEVIIRSPETAWRGRFAEFIDRRIEASLLEAGAGERGDGVPRNLEDTLRDQLLRAGSVGRDGLALRFDELDNLARAGVLDATDSRTLRWWLDAETRHALRIELSRSVAALRAYLAPVSVASLVAALGDERTAHARLSATPLMPAALLSSAAVGPRARSEEAFAPPIQAQPPARSEPPTPPASGDSATAVPEPPLEPPRATSLDVDDTPPPPSNVLGDDFFEDGSCEALLPGPRPVATPVQLAASVPATSEVTDAADDCALLQALQREPPEAVSAPAAALPARPSSESQRPGEPITPRSGPVTRRPAPPVSRDEAALRALDEKPHLRLWREGLERAEGVQSWDDLERLYIANYLPLSHALEAGEVGDAARAALGSWSSSFQECYTRAFERLKQGGQRPTMICDVPQLAFSLAREHGVPRTRLLLVDGMRFDVGQRVHDKLRLQLGKVAQCVARGVLWAALPAHSAVQLELLARGSTALRKLTPSVDQSHWVSRGAAARRLRPVRVGAISLSKLDILESDFAAERWDRETLDRAAAEVAVSVGRAIKQEPAGTLAIVFSDHGMVGYGEDGSASPEQVLVPYDAWLVGDTTA